MPTPARDEVATRVTDKLVAVSDEPVLAKQEASNLKIDLGMTAALIQAMAVPYSKISQSYDGGIKVTMVDAGKCVKVKDSIDLVFKRAQGNSS
jgi:hypothetical protein